MDPGYGEVGSACIRIERIGPREIAKENVPRLGAELEPAHTKRSRDN